ncbi:hypothetical protein Q3G72_026763 [Acer saccharum]|nr:hypothetical protein Q3G72_026763 [Acer saccharum]
MPSPSLPAVAVSISAIYGRIHRRRCQLWPSPSSYPSLSLSLSSSWLLSPLLRSSHCLLANLFSSLSGTTFFLTLSSCWIIEIREYLLFKADNNALQAENQKLHAEVGWLKLLLLHLFKQLLLLHCPYMFHKIKSLVNEDKLCCILVAMTVSRLGTLPTNACQSVAHYFEAKLLLLDAIDFSLKIQSKYGTSNKESSFKRSSLESTLEDFLAFWVHFQSILKRKNSKVFELQAHCGSEGAAWIYIIMGNGSSTLQIIQDLLKHSKIYLLACIGRDTLLVTLTNIFGTDTLDEAQEWKWCSSCLYCH